uniref:Zn(2)-C6 fungal-type domain-containing protein n=1 Tax=Mycena chlorophos TaxID=658473 RepID=A0ABQ0LQU3_MYCCL|nr:predicted protein [Mycena chlorophos]
MPKGAPSTTSARTRAPYASQACTVCRARKSKCDGVRPICSPCSSSGRQDECSWGKESAARKPKTDAHFDALQKVNDALRAYIEVLEGRLAKCVCQEKDALQFHPPELDESDAEEVGSDWGGSDEEITKELAIPAQRLKLDDELGGGLAVQGSTAPFRFDVALAPTPSAPPIAIVHDSASYILQVDGVDQPDTLDWARYLPPDVKMSRQEHDAIFDLALKFWTGWGLRVAPSLLFKDMHRALSTPASHLPLKTPSYSPMYHNSMLSICAIFSTNPYLRDPQTRTRFADHAKQFLEAECKSPQTSLVHALSFLGTFYADIGQRIMADLYVGMSTRVSMTLGLEVDSTPWMESGLITREEMLARHWTHWSVCFRDVSWALYIGRHFCGPPMDATKGPSVDEEADAVPWFYAPANIPPQPNMITATFKETFTLSHIGRKIIDIVNGLDRAQQGTRKLDQLVTQIDLELYSWKNSLPAILDITPANRGKSTPYRLMLHCEYWSYFIFLHRPFFSRKAEPNVDHVKLCKRAAENIIDIAETWSKLYGLKHATAALFQTIFSAATIHMLLALQATSTSSMRIAHVALQASMTKVEDCIRYLHDIGETWMSAKRFGVLLGEILNGKLRPIVEKRLKQRAGPVPMMVVDFSVPGQVETGYSEHQQRAVPPQPESAWYPPAQPYGQTAAAWVGENYDGHTQYVAPSMQYQPPPPPPPHHTLHRSASEVDIAAFLPNFDFGAPQYWITKQEPVSFRNS